MKLMPLGKFFAACPQPWQNFIRYYQDDRNGDVSRSRINLHLKEYNARYIGRKGTDAVEFDSNDDYIMFKLRWS